MFTNTLCRQYLQSPEYKENRFILCPCAPEGGEIHRDPNSKVFRIFFFYTLIHLSNQFKFSVKKTKNIHQCFFKYLWSK